MNQITLMDNYLPEYTFTGRHEILVNGPIEDVYEVTRNVDLSQSRLIVAMFKMIGLPTKRMDLQGIVEEIGFSRLAENYPIEHLIGFLVSTRVMPIKSAREFLTTAWAARIKIVWNFSLSEISPGLTRVTTETRIQCLSRVTRVFFRFYCAFFKPFSSVIRRRMLRIVKRQSELIGWNCYM
ncbi:MAG: hypothetical protein MI749_01260 [Desulfovibrionales bacterium]|nr:hypothetical protein [Desulfovibrionales bacterium]